MPHLEFLGATPFLSVQLANWWAAASNLRRLFRLGLSGCQGYLLHRLLDWRAQQEDSGVLHSNVLRPVSAIFLGHF